MEWDDKLASFGLTLTDGLTCKAGTNNFNESRTFDPTKKITRIEVFILKYELNIDQINFCCDEQILVMVGGTNNVFEVLKNGGRVEIFEIAEDEQLIGCELHQYKKNSAIYFAGVTWLKMKMTI